MLPGACTPALGAATTLGVLAALAVSAAVRSSPDASRATAHAQPRDCALYVRHQPPGNVARHAALIGDSDADAGARALMQRELGEGRVQVDFWIIPEHGSTDGVSVAGFDDAVAACAGHAIAQLSFPPSLINRDLQPSVELAFRLPAGGVPHSLLDALTATDDVITCTDGNTIYGPLFGDVTDSAPATPTAPSR